MELRFHLDENLALAVAEALRRRGIDVTTTVDAQLLSASDPDQLAFAHLHSRCMVTNDADFLRLAAAGTAHSGIAYCHKEKYRVGTFIHCLLKLHEQKTSEEMQGQVEYL